MAGNRCRRKITFSLCIYFYLLDMKPYEYITYSHKKLNIIFNNNNILRGC